MSLLVLSEHDVDEIIESFRPEDLESMMASAFSQYSCHPEDVQMPQRTTVSTDDQTVLFMPAHLKGLTQSQLAIKIVSVPRNASSSRGLPATTVLLDVSTGETKAVINARKLTPLRNAAGSILSTTLVGPRNPRALVVFGAGQQILAHISLFAKRFPTIESCTIINRSLNSRLLDLFQHCTKSFSNIKFQALASSTDIDKVREATKDADIIVCATSSTAPLFPSSWVRDDTHIILIGSYRPTMKEVDTDLIQRALSGSGDHRNGPGPVLLVDSIKACQMEAGELLDAGVTHDQLQEIGHVVQNARTRASGRSDDSSTQVTESGTSHSIERNSFNGAVTIFKSVGIGIQDVVIASAVLEKAVQNGIGTQIPDYNGKSSD